MSENRSDRPAVVPAVIMSRKATAIEQAMAETLTRNFDTDAYHVINRVDDGLITDEIMNGAKSGLFVYNFKIQSTDVQGISVVGATHLANEYGGIKHRIIASIEKRGNVLIATSYPASGAPMSMRAMPAHGFEDEDDFFKTVVEVENIKTGNSVQMEATEKRLGVTRGGGTFERPHYDKIAQSKARRNGLLAVLPQDVQRRFMSECLKLGNNKDITADVIDEKRRNIITFTTKHGLAIGREAVYALGMDQIEGLGQAAASGQKATFVQACVALGLLQGDGTAAPAQIGSGGGEQVGGVSQQQQASTVETKRTRAKPAEAKPAAETNKHPGVENAGDRRPAPPSDDADFG